MNDWAGKYLEMLQDGSFVVKADGEVQVKHGIDPTTLNYLLVIAGLFMVARWARVI